VKDHVFWKVTLRHWVIGFQRFEGFWLHLQGQGCARTAWTCNEILLSFDSPLTTHPKTRCNISEDLKSTTLPFFFSVVPRCLFSCLTTLFLYHSSGSMTTATVSCSNTSQLELNSCGLVNYGSHIDKCADYGDSRTSAKWKSVKGAAFPRVFGEQFDNFPHCWSSLPRLYWLRNNRCKELGCLREILSKIPFALSYD